MIYGGKVLDSSKNHNQVGWQNLRLYLFQYHLKNVAEIFAYPQSPWETFIITGRILFHLFEKSDILDTTLYPQCSN